MNQNDHNDADEYVPLMIISNANLKYNSDSQFLGTNKSEGNTHSARYETNNKCRNIDLDYENPSVVVQDCETYQNRHSLLISTADDEDDNRQELDPLSKPGATSNRQISCKQLLKACPQTKENLGVIQNRHSRIIDITDDEDDNRPELGSLVKHVATSNRQIPCKQSSKTDPQTKDNLEIVQNRHSRIIDIADDEDDNWQESDLLVRPVATPNRHISCKKLLKAGPHTTENLEIDQKNDNVSEGDEDYLIYKNQNEDAISKCGSTSLEIAQRCQRSGSCRNTPLFQKRKEFFLRKGSLCNKTTSSSLIQKYDPKSEQVSSLLISSALTSASSFSSLLSISSRRTSVSSNASTATAAEKNIIMKQCSKWQKENIMKKYDNRKIVLLLLALSIDAEFLPEFYEIFEKSPQLKAMMERLLKSNNECSYLLESLIS